MPRETDIAILGGGCAGLSLATRLIGSGRSVAVIEPRRRYTADKAWSYWNFAPHPFRNCVVKRWDRWRVSAGNRAVTRSGPGFHYETVDAGAFYATCQDRLSGANDVTLHLGMRAEIAEAGRSGVALTVEGEGEGEGPDRLHARHVVDTRPVSGQPRYGQWFAGLEVETETDRFAPEICELMRFGPARAQGIDFTYILPFSRRRALIEATVFAAQAPSDAALQAALAQAVEETTDGAPHRVIRSEAGMIPMDARFVGEALPNVVPFGVRGGAARPSTGYAFARIQARADLLARDLRAGRAPRPPKGDGPVTRAMDRLFLNVIRRRPDLGPALFLQLFEGAPETRLERFLSGSTSWGDRLAVMAALPTGLFLSHLLRP